MLAHRDEKHESEGVAQDRVCGVVFSMGNNESRAAEKKSVVVSVETKGKWTGNREEGRGTKVGGIGLKMTGN